MKINNIEFRDWVYLFFFIFTVFTLIFNTRINKININKKFNFETRTKKAEKFREKFSELLTIIDSLHRIYKIREETSKYDRTERREIYEKIKELNQKIQVHTNYLCLMIEDENLETQFIQKIRSISNYNPGDIITCKHKDLYDLYKEYSEFKKYGKYIIKNLDYKIKNQNM